MSQAELPQTLDVAIIGGGMSGTAIAFALKEKGISNIQIFDVAEEGKESHWLFSARMKTLRSGKNHTGPALGHSNLEFHAWYESRYGEEEWNKLDKIPTLLWGEYLYWLRKTLDLPVVNGERLKSILPCPDNSLELVFDKGKKVHARKVVLATGRGGYGGFEIPSFVQALSKETWAHTGEMIDPGFFSGKRICVIGCGASAFDTAAVALETGAKQVTMLMRRREFSYSNPLYLGFGRNYYGIGDERCRLFETAWHIGFRPPPEAFARVEGYPNFEIIPETMIDNITMTGEELCIKTNRGVIDTDFIVLATGYGVDGSLQPELSQCYDQIQLWKERVPDLLPKLGRFPYLGPHFEFLEKKGSSAPYLKHIYCFNFGAFLSHGR
ncbi:MAG TPA: NAD(P)/FAD-dependent oxidoreductase, partial [Rhabdochlamydiaceae bacterium]|nr:NAD(P)/FAD-dependent oxidoreductase [Rhabdochlamydiaceae bacterium]